MINPSELKLDTLPWLPLEARSAFPRQPAIYFAIDSEGTVQYIGRSINPRIRWSGHHRFSDLQRLGGIRIAYLFVDADLLPAVEESLISWFNPPLNRNSPTKPLVSKEKYRQPYRLSNGVRVRQIREVEVEGLGERIRRARLASPKSVEQLCGEVNVSRTYWYDLEKETLKGALSLENLRKIEQVLGIDFGVKFKDAEDND